MPRIKISILANAEVEVSPAFDRWTITSPKLQPAYGDTREEAITRFCMINELN
jgi:hypothetical protein